MIFSVHWSLIVLLYSMDRREVFSDNAAELQLAQESYGPGREVAHGPWITGIYSVMDPAERWLMDHG